MSRFQPAGNGFATAPGRPDPLGATLDGGGVNFAVFSSEAEAIELCLFSEDGRRERARLPLVDRSGDIWHIHVAGLTPGTLYGYRAHGPYAPEGGLRFNPNKLLIDPYARALSGRLRWSDAVMGYKVGSSRGDLSFDTRDSAFAVPRSVVVDPSFDWGDTRRPLIAPGARVICEAHVKGMTAAWPAVPRGLRGSYLGLASDPVIEHLQRLGVTTLELMPVHAFLDDRFLVARGLRNYWGYQTIGFFAPEPRYLSRGAVWEFQTMVRRLHAAGIEVILDVVFNHTGEGDALGPTLSLRGLDNRAYYRLTGGGRHYENFTGTGNTLNLTHPMVLRMVLDSLRHWVEVMGVDGFRFDLATTLAREDHGFDARGGFLDALRADPVLARAVLIAEPWDVGPGGYRLGEWPWPFAEWNDRYRDGVRRFWRGDAGQIGELARRLQGSADLFDRGGRAPTASVNYLTAHDGFTLADVVSYAAKHNAPNGEDNRDGHPENFSDNLGVEGPTDDAAIAEARAQRMRAMLATLFLSQGTPMLLAGDEAGNSQAGMNNAYAQDNEIGWVDWTAMPELAGFVAHLAALRRAHPCLRQTRFLHARTRPADGAPDLEWCLPDGRSPVEADWQNPQARALGVLYRIAADTPAHALAPGDEGDSVLALFNAGPEVALHLPPPPEGRHWRLVLNSATLEQPDPGTGAAPPDTLPAQAALAFAALGGAGPTTGRTS